MTTRIGQKNHYWPTAKAYAWVMGLPYPIPMAKEKPMEPMTCRVCGCTDEAACKGGCWWADLDLENQRGGPLCSQCVRPKARLYTDVVT